MTEKDAFDRWWEWAEKPLDSPLTIPAEMHEPVMHCHRTNVATAPRSTKRFAMDSNLAPFVLRERRTNTAFQKRRNRKNRRGGQPDSSPLSAPVCFRRDHPELP